MDEDDQFLNQVLSGIAEAEVITIFFPLLRRALVIDTRHDSQNAQLVSVMNQVSSMEERISALEKSRATLGKVRSILGIPWIKSVSGLHEHGVTQRLVERLCDADMSLLDAQRAVRAATNELSRIEHKAFISLIKGEGYQTLWTSGR